MKKVLIDEQPWAIKHNGLNVSIDNTSRRVLESQCAYLTRAWNQPTLSDCVRQIDLREKTLIFSPKTPASHSQVPRVRERTRPSEDREPGGKVCIELGGAEDAAFSSESTTASCNLVLGSAVRAAEVNVRLGNGHCEGFPAVLLDVSGGRRVVDVWFFSEKGARGKLRCGLACVRPVHLACQDITARHARIRSP